MDFSLDLMSLRVLCESYSLSSGRGMDSRVVRTTEGRRPKGRLIAVAERLCAISVLILIYSDNAKGFGMESVGK